MLNKRNNGYVSKTNRIAGQVVNHVSAAENAAQLEGVEQRMRAKKKAVTEMLAVAGACVMVAILSGQSLAQKPFLERGKKIYALQKEKNGTCKLCHTFDKEKGESPEKDNINVFGKAIQQSPEAKSVMGKDDDYKFTPEDLDKIEAAFKALDSKDADGDGASNIEELALGTFPADSKSIPAPADLEKYRKDNPKK